LLADLRYYHCNERGQVVKRQDHLVDALRYAVMAGPLYAKTKPKPPQEISMVAPHRPWSWGEGDATRDSSLSGRMELSSMKCRLFWPPDVTGPPCALLRTN
jgi:hypothetical protein